MPPVQHPPAPDLVPGVDLGAGLVPLSLEGSAAAAMAADLGIPPALFLGLCEWLETYPVASAYAGTRYDPNTRARALAWCRRLTELRDLFPA